MPKSVSAVAPGQAQVTHDPTVTLNGDPMGFLGDNPFLEMTEAIIFGAVNTLLEWIDDATGLDLLSFALALEDLLGGPLDLMTGFLGFLTPGSSTTGGGVFGPLLGLIPGLGGGTGTLGGFGDFLNPAALLTGGGIFGPLLDLIPGLSSGSSSLLDFGDWLNPATLLTGGGLFGPLLDLIPGLSSGSSSLFDFGNFLNPATLLTGGGIFGPLLDLVPGLSSGSSSLLDFGDWLNPSTLLTGGGIFGPILDQLPGIDNLFDFGDFLNNIPGLSQFLDWFGLDPGGDATTLQDWATGILTGGSPLDATNIFNFGNLFGKVPIGNLTSESVELLDNPDFREAISLQGGGIWTWDGTVGRTLPGSAKVNANGIQNVLVSNTFAVAQGDKIHPAIFAKWTGLTYTGTKPLRLEVVRLLYDPISQTFATMGFDEIAAPASPVGTQGAWFLLSGDYTVPANVSHMALRLVLDANATAGSAWFDDASCMKTGMLELGWMPEAFDNFTGIFSAFGGTGAGLSAVPNFVENLVGGIFNVADPTALSGAPGSFDPVSLGVQLIDSFIPGVGTILNSLFQGINRTTTTGHTHTEVLSSVTAQNESIVGTAASLSQLAAALGPGTPDADDFERATLGAAWRTIMSNGGTIVLNGHDLVMSHSDTTEFIALKVDKFASGDFQTSEITLGTAPGFNTILVDEAVGHNDIWLRASDFTTWATRTGIRLRWSANQHVRLSAWVNGVEVVVLFDANVAQAVAGSRMLLETGVSGNARRFVIRINGGIVPNGDVVESGTASQVGATYRRRGLGGRTEKIGVAPFAVSPDPGTLKQWTATG